MLDWVLARGDVRPLTHQAARRALRTGQLAMWALELAPGRVVTIAAVEGGVTMRRLAWPELLVDWSEINEEAPHPSETTPALAQTLSELGEPAFAVAYDPERAAAAVAWYEQGALISLEHVGRATVAWTPAGGLGRPSMSGLSGGAASVARALGGDGTILDRIEAQHAAGARAIVERVLIRLCDKPPSVDDLAGVVALSQPARIRL